MIPAALVSDRSRFCGGPPAAWRWPAADFRVEEKPIAVGLTHSEPSADDRRLATQR